MFSCDLELVVGIWHDAIIVVDLNDQKMWLQVCEQQITLFQCVMPMAMENLVIA
jgi:hypothetical protein